MKRLLIFFSLFLLIQACAAASISIEPDGDVRYLTFVSDGGESVGAYTLQLNYSSDIRLLSLEPEPPYMGASNIVNEEGYAKVSGFTIDESPPKRLARVAYTGSSDITVAVIDLYDGDGNAIPVTNPEIATPTPAPTANAPAYSADPGYVSPGSSSPTGGTTGSAVTGSPASPDVPSPSVAGGSTPTKTPAVESAPATTATVPETPAQEGSGAVPESPETTAETSIPPATQKSPMNGVMVLISVVIALILIGCKKIDF